MSWSSRRQGGRAGEVGTTLTPASSQVAPTRQDMRPPPTPPLDAAPSPTLSLSSPWAKGPQKVSLTPQGLS